MRVLVCGGRNFSDIEIITDTLNSIDRHFSIACLVHGDSTGADRIAAEWAVDWGVPVLAFPANWDKHGKQAGPLRNKQMLQKGKPNLVVAFEGGRGTEDMIRKARQAKLTVLIVGAHVGF